MALLDLYFVEQEMVRNKLHICPQRERREHTRIGRSPGQSFTRRLIPRMWLFPLLTCMLLICAAYAVSGADIKTEDPSRGRTTTMAKDLIMRPIGTVEKDGSKTILNIMPEYHAALLGLEGFSHLIVFYWFDKNDNPQKRAVLQVHPRRNPANPLTGVFATRSPARPNLIGINACKILSIEGDKIIVDSTDAFPGTPIVDIKPYIPISDCIPDATTPGWLTPED